MVGLSVDFLWFPIGDGEFVYSFFSTISYNLEESQWGSKYPYVMNKLYQGSVEYSDLQNIEREIKEIREGFKLFSPKKVIWSIEDLNKQPPWGNDISEEILDLSTYFVTCEGQDLFEIILTALENAKEEMCGVDLESL